MEDYWYVLRDLARPNAKNPAYKQLQQLPAVGGGNLFIPMKQRVFTEFGKRVVRLIPYMPDLVFVHKTRAELDPIVAQLPLLQYRYVRGGKQFEAVNELDMVEYYSFDEVSPRLYGKHIRIIGGRLNGFEGRLMSKRGSKTKRLIIDLEECNLSAAIQVETDYIQLIK